MTYYSITVVGKDQVCDLNFHGTESAMKQFVDTLVTRGDVEFINVRVGDLVVHAAP